MGKLIGLIVLVADIFAVVECLKSTKTTGKKALWIVVVLALPLIGVVLYFLMGRKQ